MVISAVGLTHSNPYEVLRSAGVTARERQSAQNQPAAERTDARSGERVIQGEVIGRAPLRNNPVDLTNDRLSDRQYRGQDSGLGFTARQAVNTYIFQQAESEQIDRYGETDQIIDVYV